MSRVWNKYITRDRRRNTLGQRPDVFFLKQKLVPTYESYVKRRLGRKAVKHFGLSGRGSLNKLLRDLFRGLRDIKIWGGHIALFKGWEAITFLDCSNRRMYTTIFPFSVKPRTWCSPSKSGSFPFWPHRSRSKVRIPENSDPWSRSQQRNPAGGEILQEAEKKRKTLHFSQSDERKSCRTLPPPPRPRLPPTNQHLAWWARPTDTGKTPFKLYWYSFTPSYSAFPRSLVKRGKLSVNWKAGQSCGEKEKLHTFSSKQWY